MPTEWYYRQNGNQHGPVSSNELKHLAASGILLPSDLVWKEGMDEWTPVAQVKGLLPETPPTSGPPPVPPAGKPAGPTTAAAGFLQREQLIWGYRGALVILLFALLCPWITVEGSASIRYGDMGRDISAQGLAGYGGRQLEGFGNQRASASFSVSGISTSWGVGVLLLVVAGMVMSFNSHTWAVPQNSQFFPNQDKALMAAFGGVSLLLMLIVLITASSYVNYDATINSTYASSSARASLSWGWYLAFLAGSAVTAIGYVIPWTTKTYSVSPVTN